MGIIMRINIILLAICIMFCVSPVIAVSQTVSFTQTATWTCPSDVNTVNLKMIGGGAGGMGGYGWRAFVSTDSNYGFGVGTGGNNGTYIQVNNIPVVPGQSYLITIGTPGVGTSGYYWLLTSSGSPFSVYGSPGQNSSAFGYTANGGVASYMTASGYSVLLSRSPIGGNGYGNYQIATTGSAGLSGYNLTTGLTTSYGAAGGIGYGSGGGGGGAGSSNYYYTINDITAGYGGNGAYGYAEITYDSEATSIILTGHVVDAYTSSAISTAVVNATQNGVVYLTSSAGDGSFTINNASLTYGVPLTVTTNKSGYASDINTFTPLASGIINLTTPLIATSYYTNTQIVGIVRDSLYGNPISSATYYAQDTTTSAIFTATSNTNGLAVVTGLTSDHFYWVWANKTGYTSPSQALVKPYS